MKYKYMVVDQTGQDVNGNPRYAFKNRRSGTVLGTTNYDDETRQYIFMPMDDMIFSEDCLQDIREFMMNHAGNDGQKIPYNSGEQVDDSQKFGVRSRERDGKPEYMLYVISTNARLGYAYHEKRWRKYVFTAASGTCYTEKQLQEIREYLLNEAGR